jgi:hypothetical protein
LNTTNDIAIQSYMKIFYSHMVGSVSSFTHTIMMCFKFVSFLKLNHRFFLSWKDDPVFFLSIIFKGIVILKVINFLRCSLHFIETNIINRHNYNHHGVIQIKLVFLLWEMDSYTWFMQTRLMMLLAVSWWNYPQQL